MRSSKNFNLFFPILLLVLISLFFCVPGVTAQQTVLPPSSVTPVTPVVPAAPSQSSRTLNPGSLSPQQIQEGMKAMERGLVSPEAIRQQMQEKRALGTLTPQEIEAGRKLLEREGREALEETPPEQMKAPERGTSEKFPTEPVKEEKNPRNRPSPKTKMSFSRKTPRLKRRTSKYSATGFSRVRRAPLHPSPLCPFRTTTSSARR